MENKKNDKLNERISYILENSKKNLKTLLDFLTNEKNIIYEKGVEVDDFSYTNGKETKEIIENRKKYIKKFEKLVEKLKNCFFPGKSFDKFEIEITKDCIGTQSICSLHKNEYVEPGFIGIFLGNYNKFKEEVIKLKEKNEENISKAFYDFLKNNLRVATPLSNKIKEVCEKHNVPYNDLEDAIRDYFLKNDESEFSNEITKQLDYKKIAKNSRILIIKEVTDGVDDIKIRKIQKTKYEINEIDPSNYKILNEEKDLQKLAKEISNKNIKNNSEAIVEFVSEYYLKNKDKSIFVLMGNPSKSREKESIKIKERIEEIIKKEVDENKRVILKSIVDVPENYYKYQTKYDGKKSIFKKAMGLASAAIISASIFLSAYHLGQINYAKKGDLIKKSDIKIHVSVKDGTGENIGKKEVYVNNELKTVIEPNVIKEVIKEAASQQKIIAYPSFEEYVKEIYIVGTDEKGKKYISKIFENGKFREKNEKERTWYPDTKIGDPLYIVHYKDPNKKEIEKILLLKICKE